MVGGVVSAPAKPQGHRQRCELRRKQTAQFRQRPVGVEVCTQCDDPGDTRYEAFGRYLRDGGQQPANKVYPVADPADGAREVDRVASQRSCRRSQALRTFGMGDDRFQRVEGSRQTCRQTVGQQAEGGSALWAVPASDAYPARRLAHVGAVARKRASAVRMVGTPFKFGAAPRLGGGILLTGDLRRMAKLHRSRGSSKKSVRATFCLDKGEDYDWAGVRPSGGIQTDSVGRGIRWWWSRC